MKKHAFLFVPLVLGLLATGCGGKETPQDNQQNGNQNQQPSGDQGGNQGGDQGGGGQQTKLDFDYINKELEKLDQVEFSNLIRSISQKVFDDEPLNEEEEQVLLYIASSGTYGTLEHSVAKGVKAKGKFGYFMSRLFPPYLFYKYAYPWAYKCPILIPIAWLARFFRILFKNPKRAKNELKTIQKYKDKE